MKFLEAKRVLASFDGGEELSFLLAMSGQSEPLDVFIRAHAAKKGFSSVSRVLPFNTLAQTLHTPAREGEIEVFLLFPWDLLPEADWRSGVPAADQTYEALQRSADNTALLLRARPKARVIYVDANLPPLSLNHTFTRAFRTHLREIMIALGATVVDEEAFALPAFLEHGSPVATPHLGTIAERIVDCALRNPREAGKVLVTDFDNTLWQGVVGEDGVDGLHYGPHGLGFPHFIYQTYLRTLKNHGILLAGVTKNDPDLAVAPLARGESELSEEDFVAIIASYSPKSAQLSELAAQLNLGLESFVFIDDNPVEIAEVSQALPAVRTLQFPGDAGGLPALIDEVSAFFHRETVTAEDRDRTDMYRRMLDGMAPQDIEGSDLSTFLADLGMTLSIHDRTNGDRVRAVQLINKTNQFNLNGIRRPESEVDELLAAGGRLVTASLSDRHGSHGEILACLIDADGVVQSLVMSCRVFQRRVEHAFLVWLARSLQPTVRLAFAATDRNAPIRQFLRDPAFTPDGDEYVADLGLFTANHARTIDLFQVAEGAQP